MNRAEEPEPEKTIFAGAQLCDSIASREAYLDQACAGRPELRRAVEELLRVSGEAGTFLEHSPLSIFPHDPAPTDWSPRSPSTAGSDGGVGQTLGRYKLLEKLGEGGCGVVYVAEQSEPVRRRVALKVIKLGMDTKTVVARFEAERQALALMDHPNIAKVFDAGATEQGRPYFVMELVRGIKITDYCDQNQLSTKSRLELFIKVCQAVQHAHQKGIIHRDIKPSNIMVTLHDGVPVPKIIDFGIAKATEGRLTDATVYTQLHQFIGTPAYMSPEQAEMSGLDMDTRSDIYSLGVLLYELLTGRTPFDAAELMAAGIDGMRRTIREVEPARPSTKLATLTGDELTTTAKRRSAEAPKLIHQLQGDLDWIVMRCLEKDRTRRYETANGLAADIKNHLHHEPVLARPPSAAYKFQKSWRRNKLAYTAVLAVAAALVMGLGISLWMYAGKSAAEREQNRLREQAEAKAREASEARALSVQQRDLARERLYDSLIREARNIRKSRRVGYRREVFDRLQQAIEVSPAEVPPNKVRTEIVATLGDWVGLDPVDIAMEGGVGIGEFTTDGSLAALAQLSNSVVSLRETRTGREVASLNVGGVVWSLAFDKRGFDLYAFTTDRALISFSSELPRRLELEKWSANAIGSWQREWIRPVSSLLQLELTDEGPVSMGLERERQRLLITDLDRDTELARIPITGALPADPSADIRPDRRHVVFASLDSESGNEFDSQLEVWDLSRKERVALIKPRLGRATSLSYSHDGRHLAASFDNTLVVFETGQYARTMSFQGSFESAVGARIGGEGLLALQGTQESVVSLIHLESGREVAQLPLRDPIAQAFSRDGSMLLVTHRDGARLVKLSVNRERQRLAGHQGGVPAVEFSPDSRTLASIGKDRTLRLWDLNGRGASQMLGHLPAPGQTLAFTPDGQHLICGFYNISELSIWSVASGGQVGQVPADPRRIGTTWAAAISPDGTYYSDVGFDTLRVWRTTNLLASVSRPGGEAKPWLIVSNGASGLVFDASGTRLAYLDVLGTQRNFITGIRTLHLEGVRESRLVATNSHPNFVQGITFLPRTGKLAYVTAQREIAIVEPDTGSGIRVIPTLEPDEDTRVFAANLRSSPDESRLAMANADGVRVDIWDPSTGQLLYTLPDEPGTIWWLAWSPNSQRLAVTRSTGDIAVWNLPEIDAELERLGMGVPSTRGKAASVPP